MRKHLRQNKITSLLICISTLLFSLNSFAYWSINETGELIKENHYRLGVAPEFIIGNGSGSNAGVYIDLPYKADMNARIMIGSGSSADFFASGTVKWVPYPDYKKQPAIGVKTGLTYGRSSSETFYDIQVAPIVSKVMDTEYGKLIPYAGLPLNFIYSNRDNRTGVQFAVGTEWVDREDYQVGAEFDLSLSNSAPTVLSIYVNFPFDGNLGFRR